MLAARKGRKNAVGGSQEQRRPYLAALGWLGGRKKCINSGLAGQLEVAVGYDRPRRAGMATAQMDTVIRHLCRAVLRQDGAGWTDGQLLACFIDQKDEAAFEALVRRHGPMVLGVCRRVLGNHHDAEDAFQATFLVLLSKAAGIRRREAVGSWLYGVAYHTARKARAMSARRHARETRAAARPRPAPTEPDADLDEALHALPEKYRVPVVLCELEGKSRREVARQL